MLGGPRLPPGDCSAAEGSSWRVVVLTFHVIRVWSAQPGRAGPWPGAWGSGLHTAPCTEVAKL